MKYTIEDVAREAGVSITTVSRVINGNYPVKKETRAKVEEVVERLNFQPNPMARGLIQRKTLSLGVVVPGITNMFFTQVVAGIERYAKSVGYEVFLNNTEGDATAECSSIKKLMGRFVDGIIVLDPQTENMKSGFYEEISSKIPLICINGFHDGQRVNFILSKEEDGTASAFEYLTGLGHKRIAFVRGGNSYSYDVKERIYRSFMEKLDSEAIVIDIADGNSTDVVENASRMIANIHKKTYIIGKDITAFFACNDLMAAGILNGCSSIGLSVPKDVSIVGFDNIILSQMTQPKLTTVDQNMTLLGEHAAKSVIALVDTGEFRCENFLVETELIIRESCKSPS